MSGRLLIYLTGAPPALPAPVERRQIREQASLRLEDLADLLQVDTSTVSRWERARVKPRGPAHALYASLLASLSAARHQPNEDDTPPVTASGASKKTGMSGLHGRL